MTDSNILRRTRRYRGGLANVMHTVIFTLAASSHADTPHSGPLVSLSRAYRADLDTRSSALDDIISWTNETAEA